MTKRDASEITSISNDPTFIPQKRHKERRIVRLFGLQCLGSQSLKEDIAGRWVSFRAIEKECRQLDLDRLAELGGTHRVIGISMMNCTFMECTLASTLRSYVGDPHLEILDLHMTPISDAAAHAVAAMLRDPDCHLDRVNLYGGSRLGEGAVSDVISALSGAATVRHLKLGDPIGGFSPSTRDALNEMIGANRTLKTLRVSGDEMCWEGIDALYRAVARSKTLDTFELWNIEYARHVFVAHAIFYMIEHTKSLRYLYLPLGIADSAVFWHGIEAAMNRNDTLVYINVLSLAKRENNKPTTIARIEAYRKDRKRCAGENNLLILGTHYCDDTTSFFGALPLEIVHMILRWHTPTHINKLCL